MPTVAFRGLDPKADFAAVRAFIDTAADYVRLETGKAPDDSYAEAYFTDCPPGSDVARSEKIGLFADGVLAGIADLAFGYPDEGDAFLGLMIISSTMRGAGLGPVFLDHVDGIARQRGAARLLLAVLDSNPRGRAFWERNGFAHVMTIERALIVGHPHRVHRMARAV